MKTLNWTAIFDILKHRRFARKMLKAGYRKHEADWEIVRGGRYREIIIDAKIDVGGKHIWTKLGVPHERN